jgi:ABC-type uncharacterized transport system permease subunit
VNGLLIALLVVLFLSTAVRDPEQSDRTPGQLAAGVRTAAWWRILGWPVALIVGGLLVALWYACRFGLYAAAYAIAAASVRVATLAALDGRGLRLHRLEGRRV